MDDCPNGTCTLSGVLGNVEVVGQFSKASYAITDTSAAKEGTVSCDPDPVPYGGSTRCTALPAEGYIFAKTMTVTGARLGECDDKGCTLIDVTGPVTVAGSFKALSSGKTAPVPTMSDIGLLLSGIALAGAAAPALRRREKQGKHANTHR